MKFYSLQWKWNNPWYKRELQTDYYQTPELAERALADILRYWETKPTKENITPVEIDTDQYPLFAVHKGKSDDMTDDGGWGTLCVDGIYPTLEAAIEASDPLDFIEPIQWGQSINGEIQIVLYQGEMEEVV